LVGHFKNLLFELVFYSNMSEICTRRFGTRRTLFRLYCADSRSLSRQEYFPAKVANYRVQ